jgi:hypothetical protein
MDGVNSNHENVSANDFYTSQAGSSRRSFRLETPQTSQISRIYFQPHRPTMNTECSLREFAHTLTEERTQFIFQVSQHRIPYSDIVEVLVTVISFNSVIVKEIVAALFLLGILL